MVFSPPTPLVPIWLQEDCTILSWRFVCVALSLTVELDQDVRALWLAIEGRFRNNKDTQAAYLNQLYLYKKGYKVAGSLSQRDPYNKICQLTIISRKDLLLDNHSIQA
jgi:hypothetical protein